MSDHRQWVELDHSNGGEAAKPQDPQSAATTTTQNSAQPAETPVPGGPDSSPDR